MQTAVLVVLLGGCLCAVHEAEELSITDVVSTEESLLSRVQNLERELAKLQSSPVAFFAGFHKDIGANHGPFNVATTIKYQQVRTNIGNGYNAATGSFTAAVRGLYVFHFSMFNTYSPRPHAKAVLKKNGVILAEVVDQSTADTHDTATRVAVVTLEAGDSVYVELPSGHCFYDANGELNSFSGFLLSPM